MPEKNITKKLMIWLSVTRANFLVLSVLLVAIGGGASRREGSFDWILFLLTMVGVILAHMSVNLLNEYSDSKTGIDEITMRTPFSGGSGTIQKGLVKNVYVAVAGYVSLAAAFLIGLYLTSVSGWPVLVIMLIGGFTTVFYTGYLARWGVGEFASGISLGSLVVIGTYFVQTSRFTPAIFWLSVPAGILTMLLLLLNEFPDMEADRKGGRRHLVIILGKEKAAFIYSILLGAVYASIAYGILTGAIPVYASIAFLTTPLAYRAAFITLKHHRDFERMVQAQGLNVLVVLGTDFLLTAGLFI